MDYIILVITYNRVDICFKKTLSTLKDNKIPSKLINLVVHNKEQADLYKKGIPKEYYNKIIITNENKGIYGQMNWVFRKYKVGQKILKLDDDISGIYKLQGEKLVKTYTLNSIINEGFKLCDENGFKLWGIYPVANAYFMTEQKSYTTDLRFVVGALMGIINEKIQIDLDIKIKGDFEYAILSYLKNGGMIRFNRITFKYDIAKNENERINTMISDANILIKKYPTLVKHNTRRNKDKPMGEILLNKSEIKGGKIHNLNDIPVDDMDSVAVVLDKIEQTKPIKELQSKLLKALENAKIPRVEGKRKDGRRTRGDVIGYEGYTFTMGIGHRREKGISEFTANEREPELFKLVVEYGNKILPTGFEYSLITINKNLKAKKHIDGGNAGFSCITFLGDYTGGGLYIYDVNDKPTLYDTHNTLTIFNGSNLAHRTEPYKGDRYALIYYNQINTKKIKGVKMIGEGIN
jgi:hypothetical protein